MVVLRKVGVMSLAKITAVLSAIAGLVQGIMFTSIGTIISRIAGGTPLAALGTFGAMAIVIFPIGGAISGFIGGAIGAFLYNSVAARIGGVEIDLIGGLPVVTSAAPPVTPTSTKFCVHCRAKIPTNAKFCGSCGANQE